MITRYVITLGAPTTAGGKVTSADHFDMIDGVPVAVEGDTCWCPACDSEGLIRPDGPRLSDTFDGREIALQDDLCICQCLPPPRLLAAQTFMWQSIDADGYANRAATAAGAAATANAAGKNAGEADEAPLVLIDPDTQEPLRHRAYRLQLKDGLIEGTTDHKGWTRPLSAAERAGLIAWQLPSAGA